MGIDIESKLMYGMNYGHLVANLSEEMIEELDESLDYGEVEYASPYYDADRDAWFVGFELSDWFNLKKIDGFKQELLLAEKEFVERFGITGFVRCTPHVY